MIINTFKTRKTYTRKSKFGKEVIYSRESTIFELECDICKRKLTRSKGEAYKLESREKHACSPECIGKLTNLLNPRLPRAARRKSGYIYIGNRRQHQIIAEEKLGRSLKSGEIVHHIDGDKGNNKPENIYVCSSIKEHNRIHGQIEALAMLLVQQNKITFDHNTGLYSFS